LEAQPTDKALIPGMQDGIAERLPPIATTRVVNSKRQRELGPKDLQKALDAVSGAVAATLTLEASAALRRQTALLRDD
jgi:hypothetical protein